MSAFSQAYGILERIDREGQPFSEVTITEPYLNWNNSAYGGCFMLIASVAAQNVVGKGPIGCNYTFRFIKKVLFNETMTTKATLLKSGRMSVMASADVYASDQLVASMQTDYFLASDLIPFEVSSPQTGTMRPPCDFYLNDKSDPVRSEPGYSFQQMLCGLSKKKQVEEGDFNGQACVGLYTDEHFSDLNGHVDPATFGILMDIAAGIACWSKGGPCVTTNLTMSVLQAVRPGASLACQAELMVETGGLMLVEGTFWDGDIQVGTCSGTFIQMNRK